LCVGVFLSSSRQNFVLSCRPFVFPCRSPPTALTLDLLLFLFSSARVPDVASAVVCGLCSLFPCLSLVVRVVPLFPAFSVFFLELFLLLAECCSRAPVFPRKGMEFERIVLDVGFFQLGPFISPSFRVFYILGGSACSLFSSLLQPYI